MQKRNALERALDRVAGAGEYYEVRRDGVTIGRWETEAQARAHVNRMTGTEQEELGWFLMCN